MSTTGIEKVLRLNHPGVLRNFNWPSDLPEFGRFNLIYGWNGSGKTTLSRCFRALEQRKPYLPGQVTLVCNGQEMDGKDFPGATIPIRVFNRDFVSENIFLTGERDVPPIFIVGKENIEKQKEVTRLKARLARRLSDLENTRSTLSQGQENLDRHCIQRARLIKETLRTAGPGKYNDYNKAKYRSDVENMQQNGDSSSHRLTDEEYEIRKAEIQQSAPKRRIEPIGVNFPSLTQIQSKVAELLTTTVTASVIAALTEDAPLSNWLKAGLDLHKARNANTCFFCEQGLPDDRLSILEAHFNEEYNRLLRNIDNQKEQLDRILKDINDLTLPDEAALYDHLRVRYEGARASLTAARDSVAHYIRSLTAVLDSKKERPFERLEFDISAPSIDESGIDRINQIISAHNAVCDNFAEEIQRARDDIANHLLAEGLDDFLQLSGAVKTACNSIESIENEIGQLNEKIDSLEREIIEHRQPAEELNDDLRKYLGHDEILLEVKATGYRILRNGEPAESLSEGEHTAVALLYFLKSLHDQRFDLHNGVVVLDDPISSLDENALYLAFGFVRERTKDAGQLFILTHNFSFFRQVRNWFNRQRGQGKQDIRKRPAHFYMLEQVAGATPRRTTLRTLDPLLQKYNSEYHYLFARVYQVAKSTTGSPSLEESYALANIARRLLEMFLAFKRPDITDDLWKKLNSVDFDSARRTRILRFTHTYSHSDFVVEPGHDPSLLREAPAVLNDLLELIEKEDQQHFDAMKRLVLARLGEEEVD